MTKMICIGVPKRHFLHITHYPGCGETWTRDFPDGKCPICRGFLVEEDKGNDSPRKDEGRLPV